MSYNKSSSSKFSSNSSSASNDFLKIAGLTLLPVGLTAGGWYYFAQHKEQVEWFNNLKKPSWAISNCSSCAQALDMLLIAPLGYSTYLITKDGTDSSDVKTALVALGGSLGVWGLSFIAISKNRDLKCWVGCMVAGAAVSGVASSLCYKLNETAGLLIAPLAAWYAYYAAEFLATHMLEKKKE